MFRSEGLKQNALFEGTAHSHKYYNVKILTITRGFQMATVSFGTFSKKRNSTKQPVSLSDQRTVTLKESCSQDRPVFICTGNNFSYNYCMWDSKYYFIDQIISLHNNLIEIHCVMDALATYKSYILAGTHFVSYSSQAGNTWLADDRIPVLKSTVASKSTAGLPIFNTSGFYVLSVVGRNGCETFCLNKSTLEALLSEIQNWEDDGINNIINSLPTPSASADETSALDQLSNMLIAVQEASTKTGFIGNSFANAPECIRSCIWVPFLLSAFSGGSKRIWLGNYDTQQAGFMLNGSPTTGSISVSIPWHFSDWRRGYCEDVYLYLPLVGMVGISSESLTHANSITVKYSATGTDGTVCYQIVSGNEIIGSYGGQCSANYPIGINQQASAGEVVTSLANGASKMVASAVRSSLSPISIGGAIGGIALEGVRGTYDTVNTANSTHVSCVGGIGGGAGVGLDLNVTCYTVAHDTIINPSDMQDTMGLPTMKPMALSSLTGFCQCANAHVDAPATAGELDAIDYYLNSGFFIE